MSTANLKSASTTKTKCIRKRLAPADEHDPRPKRRDGIGRRPAQAGCRPRDQDGPARHGPIRWRVPCEYSLTDLIADPGKAPDDGHFECVIDQRLEIHASPFVQDARVPGRPRAGAIA